MKAGLDLLPDVALDARGLAGGEVGQEVARVGRREDAIGDIELADQRFLGRVVADAEQAAEVEAGALDVAVVVLDEAGALAHHALDRVVQGRPCSSRSWRR